MVAVSFSSVAVVGLLVTSAVSTGNGPSIVPARGLRGVLQLRGLFVEPTAEGEPVECELASDDAGYERKLLLLTSSGLGDWGAGSDPPLVPNANLTLALRELVLQLPEAAWAGGEKEGAQRKARAGERNTKWLLKSRFRESDLYSGLDVAVINDACFLKDSFWNEENPMFSPNSGIGLNYKVAGIHTSSAVVSPFFGDRLDGGYCVNFAADEPGYLGSLGFDPERVHHVSLWDSLAPHDLTEALLEMQVGRKTSRPSEMDTADMSTEAAKELRSRLAAADIIVVNGGNPDFLAFVLERFGAEAMEPVLENVKAGRTIWLGQSAGSMVLGADMGLSYENGPTLLGQLRKFNTTGFGISGICAIRPHVSGSSWSLTAGVYGKLKHVNMVLVPDGNALLCQQGSCSRIGAPNAPEPFFHGSDDPHLERLAAAFSTAAAADAASRLGV